MLELLYRGNVFTVNPSKPAMRFSNGLYISNAIWFSSMEVVDKNKKKLPKLVKFNDMKYASYDHHPEIIFIEKIKDIPYDYNGLMAVPITLLYYDWSDYEIKGVCFSVGSGNKPVYGRMCICDSVDNKVKFIRLIIRRRTNI